MNKSVDTIVKAVVDSVILVWERDVTGKAIVYKKLPVNQTIEMQPDTAHVFVVATYEGHNINCTLHFSVSDAKCCASGVLEGFPEVEVAIIGLFKAHVTNTARRSTGLKLPVAPKQLAALTKPTRRRDWVPRKYGR